MRHEKKYVYHNVHRKSTVECDDNFVVYRLYVLPLNTLGKQWHKCSYVDELMDREKIGRCHAREYE